jgi:hypothetical protein
MQMPPTMLPHDLRLLIDPPPSVPPLYDADSVLIGPARRGQRRQNWRRPLRALATRLAEVARHGRADREPTAFGVLLPLYGELQSARGERWTSN